MRAEADLIARTPFKLEELKRLFGNQIDDNIIREIAAMDPAKQLKAIEDVKFFIKSRKNLKQELMLRDLDVTGKKGHALGGRVPLAGGLSTEWDNVPPVKMPDPFEKIWEKMTPEEKEMHKMQMEIMKRGFEIDPYEGMSEEEIEFMKNQLKIRERQRKDRGLPEWIQLMNQGGLAGMLGE